MSTTVKIYLTAGELLQFLKTKRPRFICNGVTAQISASLASNPRDTMVMDGALLMSPVVGEYETLYFANNKFAHALYDAVSFILKQCDWWTETFVESNHRYTHGTIESEFSLGESVNGEFQIVAQTVTGERWIIPNTYDGFIDFKIRIFTEFVAKMGADFVVINDLFDVVPSEDDSDYSDEWDDEEEQ